MNNEIDGFPQESTLQPTQPLTGALMSMGHNNFLNDLFQLRESKHKLKMEILKRADEFLLGNCLHQLTVAKYPWLNDSLLELRCNQDLSLEKMLGILTGLTAIGHYTCGHVQTFIADISSEVREHLLS